MHGLSLSLVFQGEPFQPHTFDSKVVCENPSNNLNLFKGYVWVSEINFTQFHARLTTSRLHRDCLFCQIHTNEQCLFGLHFCHFLMRETASTLWCVTEENMFMSLGLKLKTCTLLDFLWEAHICPLTPFLIHKKKKWLCKL